MCSPRLVEYTTGLLTRKLRDTLRRQSHAEFAKDYPIMPLSAAELKQHFNLDPDVVFLNHGSFGACPKPVFAEWQRWQAEMERQPVEFIGRRQEGLLDHARAELATYVGCGADDLTFVTNTTAAINIIARSLDLRPGDEILGTNLEYGALDYTWDYLCGKAGARYVRQEISLPVTSRENVVEQFWQGVNENTKAIFISHITSATALTLPAEEICARAKAAGILSIVDGAHVPGQLPLNLATLGADIYAGNCHKWLCSPKGSAFLYVHPDQQHWVESGIISWGWHPGNTFVTRNQQQGTRDVSPFLTVPAAIDWQREFEWDAVRERCHTELRAFVDRMHAMLGTKSIYPDDSWYAQLAVITLPAGDHTGLKERLEDRGIEIPVTAHGDRTFVRVSMQGYVTQDDLAALEQALIEEFGTSGSA